MQTTAVQSPLRFKMAMWSTWFAITVSRTTSCAPKGTVSPGRVSLLHTPALIFPQWMGLGWLVVHMGSLEPGDLD